MSDRILILGGTKEATALAKELLDAGQFPITSLAGRTKEPKPVAGEIRIGGFGGAEKMAEWMMSQKIDKVIDATHPFATQISMNAVAACELANIPLEIRCRKPWQSTKGDIWSEVDTLQQAAIIIPARSRVFLALGSQHLEAFFDREDVFYVVRMVDQPSNCVPLKHCQVILGRPSVDWREEAQLLKEHEISHIICRNSGGIGAYAKIEAARRLAIPVIIVTMPK